eukprot:TRINITY_DN128_c0_g1_i1.p1 TRINITY_DN128_c0_g1~~TRINITY_DN128_c0_g1_i1.p1  ORF type:complete len:757 (-),score=284.55 TRINITY_DN128_c0_g1_i1:234-2504(-)
MPALSKFAMAKTVGWMMLKKNINSKSIFLAGFVGLGSVILARGMRRDRQSKTAAITEKLLDQQKKEKEKKKKRAKKQTFFTRLSQILKIIIPGWKSKEAYFIGILSLLLIARTIFSVIIAELIGKNVMHLVSKNWFMAIQGVLMFFLLSFPASYINSFLKLVSQMLALLFRVRLSQYVNKQYIKGVNFYAACNLHGISDVDQRVTTDIKQFCEEISSLYSSIFKPILDIVLFTNQLRRVTGWQGPAFMYSYFLLSAIVKRVINRRARFGKLVAGESAREGQYRTAHQRLINNSEEVAFYDGSFRELNLIDDSLDELFKFGRNHRYVRAAVEVCDQLFIKYWATLAGYFVMWIPIWINSDPNKTTSDLTRDYARISRYLANVANAVGDLVLVINTLATISGRTRRVSELIETVRHLDEKPTPPFTLRETDRGSDRTNPNLEGIDEWLDNWEKRCDIQRNKRLKKAKKKAPRALENGGTYIEGDIIKFDHCDIVSPGGTCLAKDLTLSVKHNQNVMITGPNGAGKSSIFRVIGELWPLSCGTLTKPPKEDFLFVPQKPYLVKGTLRDQIIYPHSQSDMERNNVTDEDLARLLALVDPKNDILSTWEFDEEKDWFRAFSGGQKQRVAMSRVFYHCPLYAILDECTSAVSSDVENKIYETGRRLGITLFTVSHRESLKIHHDYILYIEGIEGKYRFDPIPKDDVKSISNNNNDDVTDDIIDDNEESINNETDNEADNGESDDETDNGESDDDNDDDNDDN